MNYILINRNLFLTTYNHIANERARKEEGTNMSTSLKAQEVMVERMVGVADAIEMLKHRGIETFKITQISDKYRTNDPVFVHNLSFEYDRNELLGDLFMATDFEDRLLNVESVLMAFAPESILSIDEFTNYEGFCIKFKGVSVKIEATGMPYEE